MPQGSIRKETGSWPSVLSQLEAIDLDTTISLLSNAVRHAEGCTCLLPQMTVSSPPKEYEIVSSQQCRTSLHFFESHFVASEGEADEHAAFCCHDGADDELSCASPESTKRRSGDATDSYESHTQKLPRLRGLRGQANVKAAFLNAESDDNTPITPTMPTKRWLEQIARQYHENDSEMCRCLRRREKSSVLRSKYVLQGLDGQYYLPGEDLGIENIYGSQYHTLAYDKSSCASDSDDDDSPSPSGIGQWQSEDFSSPSSLRAPRVSALLPARCDNLSSVDNVQEWIKDSTDARPPLFLGPSHPLPDTPPRNSWLRQGYSFSPADFSMKYLPPRSTSSAGANPSSEASVGTGILYSDAESEDLLEDVALSKGSNSPQSDEQVEFGVARVVHFGTPVRIYGDCGARKV